MKPDKYEIELDSKIENLPVVSDFIDNTLIHFQAEADSIFKIQLAVDEVCTNIINYAYQGVIGSIKIQLELTGDDIIITIKDKGKRFDPTSVPPPDVNSDLEQRKIGGLGVHFVKKLMDSISYSFDPREGNILSLRKKRVTGTNILHDKPDATR